MVKVFIDPGHGGSDSGAIANGLREKDVCLNIALKLKDILRSTYTGHQLKLSRTTDKMVSLRERTQMANQWGADYFISIHINAGGGTGFESYIYNQPAKRRGKTKRYQEIMQAEIIKLTSFKDRGSKAANFHVLRETAMPAILTENGFIDSKNDSHIQHIAYAHAVGIAKCLSLKRQVNDKLEGVYHTIKRGDTLWKLSKRYNTTVKKLLALNVNIDPYNLNIDEKLRVK